MKEWARFFIIFEAVVRFIGGIVLLLLGGVVDRYYQMYPETRSVTTTLEDGTTSTYTVVVSQTPGWVYTLFGVILLLVGIAAIVLIYFSMKYMDEKDPRFIYVSIVGFFVGGMIAYTLYFFSLKKDFELVDKLEAEMSPPIDEEKVDVKEEPIL